MKLSDFQIFDTYLTYQGKKIEPVNGLIEITINGVLKTFVFEKFKDYLSRKGQKVKKQKGKHRSRPVKVITPENEIIRFESSAEAARELNICRTNIPHALSGRYKHVEGYKFSYVN